MLFGDSISWGLVAHSQNHFILKRLVMSLLIWVPFPDIYLFVDKIKRRTLLNNHFWTTDFPFSLKDFGYLCCILVFKDVVHQTSHLMYNRNVPLLVEGQSPQSSRSDQWVKSQGRIWLFVCESLIKKSLVSNFQVRQRKGWHSEVTVVLLEKQVRTCRW